LRSGYRRSRWTTIERAPIRPLDRSERPLGGVAKRDEVGAEPVLRETRGGCGRDPGQPPRCAPFRFPGPCLEHEAHGRVAEVVLDQLPPPVVLGDGHSRDRCFIPAIGRKDHRRKTAGRAQVSPLRRWRRSRRRQRPLPTILSGVRVTRSSWSPAPTRRRSPLRRQRTSVCAASWNERRQLARRVGDPAVIPRNPTGNPDPTACVAWTPRTGGLRPRSSARSPVRPDVPARST
jgi:hypothetical protein